MSFQSLLQIVVLTSAIAVATMMMSGLMTIMVMVRFLFRLQLQLLRYLQHCVRPLRVSLTLVLALTVALVLVQARPSAMLVAAHRERKLRYDKCMDIAYNRTA